MLLWLQDEKFDPSKGPSISDLVAKETVDKLTYMGWELDQAADPIKVHVYTCSVEVNYTHTLHRTTYIHNVCTCMYMYYVHMCTLSSVFIHMYVYIHCIPVY